MHRQGLDRFVGRFDADEAFLGAIGCYWWLFRGFFGAYPGACGALGGEKESFEMGGFVYFDGCKRNRSHLIESKIRQERMDS